jgi:hypothetical protein
MAERRQTNIGIDRGDYDCLNEKKKAVEGLIGRRLTWGDFLMILTGLHSVDELIGKQPEVAELHEIDKALGEAEEVEWLTRRDIEEVVRAEGDRIIMELKR